MICVSLQHKSIDELLDILSRQDVEMAEIRLDLCDLSLEDIETLFSSVDKPLIATCRLSSPGIDIHVAEERLACAIEAGAAYADVEMEAPAALGKRIRRLRDECGTLLIRSWHDFTGTPPLPVLQSLVSRCFSFGGDIAKIVTTATSKADCDTIMKLYGDGSLVAFAMGEAGRDTRFECLAHGAPFTYAAITTDAATAPGQWTAADLNARLYAPLRPGRFTRPSAETAPSSTKQPLFVDKPTETAPSSTKHPLFVDNPAEIAPSSTKHPLFVDGAMRMPASKSFAQRAIVAAALAEGTSHLGGYSPCGDNEAAIAVARAIGADVKVEGNNLTIKGIAAEPGCLHLETLHTGESGFLTRLMIPLLSVLSDCPTLVTGEKTLMRRPLSGAHDIMAAFGVRLYPEDPHATSRDTDCCVPLTVKGPLIPGRADIDGRGGSQLISGLLTALPLCEGKSTLYISDPRSIPYMFITVDVLKRFGVAVSSEMEGGESFLESQDWSDCTGVSFKIKGGQRFHAADFDIEADWSGAAPLLVGGAIFGEVEVSGLDTSSLQADISIIDILTEAGAGLSRDENGVIRVCKAPLRAIEADLTNCPDLFPAVAVLAAFCEGESRLKGTDRLAHKETDRARAIQESLTKLGVPASVEDDILTVRGMSLSHRLASGNLLRGGSFTTYSDHRIAMALTIASYGADSPLTLDDPTCVSKSFPDFFRLLSASR